VARRRKKLRSNSEKRKEKKVKSTFFSFALLKQSGSELGVFPECL
jgi:hypothetical protein